VVGAELTSHLIATSARNRGLTDILTELLTVQVGNQFYKVPLPADWQQLTFAQTSLHVKEHYDGILVALERKEGSKLKSMINPPATTLTQGGDQMVLIARHAPGGKG
jgi:voltage-gated potassium channel